MRPKTAVRCSPAALLALALIAFSACTPALAPAGPSVAATPVSSRSAPPPSASYTPPPPIDLHGVGIEIWHPWYGPEASLLDTDVAEFNRDNRWGITVRTKGHTNFTELFDSVTEALQAEKAPDLAIGMPEYATAWDTTGQVVDLTTYVSDASLGLTREQIADFPEVFWQQDIVEGRRLGLPAERSAHFLIYNQSWARGLGFAEPPSTPQEFREQVCAAHAVLGQDDDATNDGRGGWLVRADGMTLLSWLSAFGGGVLDGEGYRFLSPRNLEATVFIKQLFDDGCAWVAPVSDEAPADFSNRQALFTTAPLEELSDWGRAMAAAENADRWTVVGFPGGDHATIQVYGASFIMFKSTPKNQLAAWLFMRWLLEPQRQEQWVEVTGLLPLRSSTLGSLNAYARSHPQWADATKLLAHAEAPPQLASWRQVRIMMGDGFDAMFRANTPAGRVAEILAIMDRTADDLSP